MNKYVSSNKRNNNIRKKFTKTNSKRLQKALVYIGNNLIDSYDGVYLTIDYLRERNNIITG